MNPTTNPNIGESSDTTLWQQAPLYITTLLYLLFPQVVFQIKILFFSSQQSTTYDLRAIHIFDNHGTAFHYPASCSRSNSGNLWSHKSLSELGNGSRGNPVENNHFRLSPEQLGETHSPKSLEAYFQPGGLEGLEKVLETNCHSGLPLDETNLNGIIAVDWAVGTSLSQKFGMAEQIMVRRITSSASKMRVNPFSDRRRIDNVNRLPKKNAKSTAEFAWPTYHDEGLIPLLNVAAAAFVIFHAPRIYQLVHMEKGKAQVKWIEGVWTKIAALVTFIVGSPFLPEIVCKNIAAITRRFTNYDLASNGPVASAGTGGFAVDGASASLMIQLKDRLKGSSIKQPKSHIDFKGIVMLLAFMQMMAPVLASQGAVNLTMDGDIMWPSSERPVFSICVIVILFNVCTRIWSREFKKSGIAFALLVITTLAVWFSLPDIIASNVLLLSILVQQLNLCHLFAQGSHEVVSGRSFRMSIHFWPIIFIVTLIEAYFLSFSWVWTTQLQWLVSTIPWVGVNVLVCVYLGCLWAAYIEPWLLPHRGRQPQDEGV